MFGEKFLNSLKMANSKKVQEAEVIHEKGSLQNPYSLAELEILKKERLKNDKITHFNGYVNKSNDPKNPDVKHFNFVEKDSNNYTVNFSSPQKITRVYLNTIKDEQGFSNSKLSFSAREGILNKKIIFKINHDLPLKVKKEIVEAVYNKLEEKKFTSNYFRWDEEAKANLETECRQEFLSTVAGIVRKNIDVLGDDPVDIKILQ